MVPPKPWNQVNMQVRHRLACGCAVVDADIEAIRVQADLQFFPRLIEQGEQIASLRRRELEEAAHMPLRNHQGVTRRDRIGITDHQTMRVLSHDPRLGQGAEGAEFR